MNDTPPEIYKKMNEMFQKKTPEERFKMSFSMFQTAKYLVTCSILEENPTLTKAGIKRELFLRFYGAEYTAEEREKIIKHLDKYTEE